MPQSSAAKPKFNPKPARGLDAIAMVQATAARSLMDTIKVRDGRSIGDVPFEELGNIAKEHEQEALRLRNMASALKAKAR